MRDGDLYLNVDFVVKPTFRDSVNEIKHLQIERGMASYRSVVVSDGDFVSSTWSDPSCSCSSLMQLTSTTLSDSDIGP